MTTSWQTEICGYIPRLQMLPHQIQEAASLLNTLGLTAPMNPTENVRRTILNQLILFNIGSLRVALDLAEAADFLFSIGKITSACLQIRLLFELWGSVDFGSTICGRVCEATDLRDAVTLEGISAPISKLISGSRFQVTLPRGGETDVRSYNVMKFIDHLDKCEPGNAKIYDFLCEACHPSFVQQSYFWMAGSKGDNWTNQAFRRHAHELLEQLIAAAEKATAGLAHATEHVIELVRPFSKSPNV